jgi:predicted esterase
MANRVFSLLFASLGCATLTITGCSSDDGGDTTQEPLPASTTQGGPATPAPTPTAAPAKTADPKPASVDDPGPAPKGCGTLQKDNNGFFTRTTSKSPYVGYIPKSYNGQPTTLVVAIHGCGDSAYNFATWAANPYDGRQKQTHIGISIGGKDGQCWDTSSNNDVDKVMAAIADISTCVYVHKQKVVLAGYSSGGILAYKIGLTQAPKFAGIIIENSGLEGTQPSAAAWKINVAHIAHKQDTEFPLKNTEADWTKLKAAGIPLQTSEVDGTHDGTSDDWNNFLLPKIGTWKAP